MDWIKRNSLKKGDTIYLEENGRGELILNPKLREHKKELKEIVINTNSKDINRIKRELISAYLGGYGIIKIQGEDLMKFSKEIKEEVRNLVAVEIMEHTKDEILVKDLLSLEEISLKDMIRRMDIITRAMISSLKSSFLEGRLQNIDHLDYDVNRIYFVILRALIHSLNDPNFASLIKLEQAQLFSYWNISNSIEVIADQIKEISRFSLDKLEKTKIAKEIVPLISDIENMYLEIMKAYYTGDVELAYKLSSEKKELSAKCDSFLEKKWKVHCIPETICKLKNVVDETHKIIRRVYS